MNTDSDLSAVSDITALERAAAIMRDWLEDNADEGAKKYYRGAANCAQQVADRIKVHMYDRGKK